jgi:hypothetical protein
MPPTDRRRKYLARLRRERQELVSGIKAAQGCARCYEAGPACLDLHHVTGKKEANVSSLVSQNRPVQTILAEAAKCQVLCANCHRCEHASDTHVFGPLTRRVFEIKSRRGCSSCGETRPAALDYHHIDTKTKNGTVSVLARQGHPWPKIINEIKKCCLLCANCHRKLHAGQALSTVPRPIALTPDEVAEPTYLPLGRTPAPVLFPDHPKQCLGPCGRLLPRGCFSTHRQKPDGLQPFCRDCQRANCRKNYRERMTRRQPLTARIV